MKKLTVGMLLVLLSALVHAKNRNPKDYPQKIEILSFSRETESRSVNCTNVPPTVYLGREITPGRTNCTGGDREHHIYKIRIDGQEQPYTVSCYKCDTLIPGQVYPGKLNLKDMEVDIIHQKGNGSWGLDNYAITNMEADKPRPQATTQDKSKP